MRIPIRHCIVVYIQVPLIVTKSMLILASDCIEIKMNHRCKSRAKNDNMVPFLSIWSET